MILSQLAQYPGIMAYRGSLTGHKVHIAVKWQGKSLCGLYVPQNTWQPAGDDVICRSCLNSVRVVGRIAK